MGTRTTDTPAAELSVIERSTSGPVAIDLGDDHDRSEASAISLVTPKVAALIVTWNRHAAVSAALEALARQTFDRSRLHIVVIENASSDGTGDRLIERWSPDSIVDNPTTRADEPDFRVSESARDGDQRASGDQRAPGDERGAPPHGFASFTLVRNKHNLGGCGGFNTGLAFAERFLDTVRDPLSYVWLVDDDVDLPSDALERLVETGESDRTIGLVGSRTVDFDHRASTIETTIYYDAKSGRMGPEPASDHRLAGSHAAWVAHVGGTNGERAFSGVREVDVVSACSLLARWSAVKDVGFWDRRYFIYCDDADWCLRFAARGHRVVCDLDAVVFHTYWLSKLTPVRAYYAARNLFWVNQKAADPLRVRRILSRQLASALLNSYKMAVHCQATHAEIFRRTADDAVRNRGGKLEIDTPRARPLIEAFDDAGALGADRHIAVMCSAEESIAWADDVRANLAHALIDAGRAGEAPRWTLVCKKGVPISTGAHWLHDAPGGASRRGQHPARVEFAGNALSKLKLQCWLLREAPDAVLIIDQSNEAPLLWSRRNILIDRRTPGMAQVERDGWRVRTRLALRWIGTAVRCGLFALRARRVEHKGKYQ